MAQAFAASGTSAMREIPLTRGMAVLVDDADYEEFSKYSWNAHRSRGNFYASRGLNVGRVNGKKRIITFKMHREIMSAQPGQIIDHINRNTLDNRKSNLRVVTIRENKINENMRSDNTSGYRGVSFDRQHGKWRSRLKSHGQRYSGGLFLTAEEAARSYDELAVEHHGEFAVLNFPQEKNL
jgi:hypothetical protein